MLPGDLGSKIGSDEEGAARFKRFRVIMDSMNDKELDGVVKMDDSRAARVARGSGTSKRDVDMLLQVHKQFEKTFGNKNMKKLMKGSDSAFSQQMGRNPKAVMQQLQKSMSPAMLQTMGGAGGMMDMMKQMTGGDMDMRAMMESMGGAGGLAGLMGGAGAGAGKGRRARGRRK